MPSPFVYENIWLKGDQKNYFISSNGSGVFKIQHEASAENREHRLESYTWENAHYRFEICPAKKSIRLNGKPAGELWLEKDDGDTYNADITQFQTIPEATIIALTLREEHPEYARLSLERKILHEGIVIHTHEDIFYEYHACGRMEYLSDVNRQELPAQICLRYARHLFAGVCQNAL
jgi:hypothetical protein